jgi:long-chain acyl-CoA synthetase
MAEVKPYLVITVPLVMEKIFKSKVAPVINKPIMKVITSIPGLNQVIFKKIRNTLLNAFGGNVREIVMGGAALNPDVEKWFRKFKLPFTVGYGMTEAAPLLAYEIGGNSLQSLAERQLTALRCALILTILTIR